MRKVMWLTSGVLAAASVSGAAFAQGVPSMPIITAPTGSTAMTFSTPPISDQQLQQLAPALGIVTGVAQQLVDVGAQGMDRGLSAGQGGAQSGGQLSTPGAGASPTTSLQSGLSLGMAQVPMPHM
jgi:hypothetical protein